MTTTQPQAPAAGAGLPDPLTLLPTALDAVRAGARLALDPGEALQVGTKRNRNDVVTQVDRGVEALIARLLEPTGYALVGEEGHAADSWAGRVWVLDPIDGTLNYVAVHRHWAISLALVEDGEPVLGIVADPVDDRLHVALAGRGAWEGRLEPWIGEGDDGGAVVASAVPTGAPGTGSSAAAGHAVHPSVTAPDHAGSANGPAGAAGNAQPRSDAGADAVPAEVARLVPGAHPLRVDDVPLADGVVIAHAHGLAALRHLPAICESTRGMRCYGAAALELAEVAAGRAGVLVHTRLQPWDVAAGVLLCTEAGAVVSRLDGTRADVWEPGSLLAGTPSAAAEMRRRLVEG